MGCSSCTGPQGYLLSRLGTVTRRQHWGLSSFTTLGMLPRSPAVLFTLLQTALQRPHCAGLALSPTQGKRRLQLSRGLWPPRESSQADPHTRGHGPRQPCGKALGGQGRGE